MPGEKPAISNGNRKKRTLPKECEPFKFQPGKSGNPSGRPKRDVAQEIARIIFEAEGNPEAIGKAFLKKLKKGDSKAFAVLSERAYGKVPQAHTLEGGDNPINVNVRFVGE